MIDNMIKHYLRGIAKQIEDRNKYSDFKKYHIRYEKLEVITKLLVDKKITDKDIPEAKKILKIRG